MELSESIMKKLLKDFSAKTCQAKAAFCEQWKASNVPLVTFIQLLALTPSKTDAVMYLFFFSGPQTNTYHASGVVILEMRRSLLVLHFLDGSKREESPIPKKQFQT